MKTHSLLLRLLALVALTACTSTPDLPPGQCLFDADCESPLRCVAQACRAPCRTDADCLPSQVCTGGDVSGVRICTARTGERSCVYSTECPKGQVCTRDGVCRAQCQNNYDCQVINPYLTCSASRACELVCRSGTANCDGDVRNGCEADLASVAHCGACGRACAAGQSCARQGDGSLACTSEMCPAERPMRCDGACVDPSADSAHCGACGNACGTRPNGTSACVAGRCALTCNSGFGDCDMNPAIGCETDLSTAAAHCGACGSACSAANGTPTCASGRCAIACGAGYGDCDGNLTNGCETDTRTTSDHCGMCGRACALPNATATCAAGSCAVMTCVANRGDCDRDAASGCETDLQAAPAHCGACGRACPASQVCLQGSCATDCGMLTACSGACANLQTSVTHCGRCGNACNFANGVAACVGGTCTLARCNAGFGDCDMNPANGCETNLSTTTAHCGACGSACSAANGTAACMAGRCSITCATGFGDCDMNVANGCETSTRSAVSHCGACGRACSLANATPACANGTCAVAACAAGFGDCDMNVANGCETNLNTSATHCGMCGRACSLAHATAACSTGGCVIARCDAGYGDCDGDPSDGCETDLRTSATHCGACGSACSLPRATAQCSAGACAVAACDAGFGNCDMSPANGCETDLSTSSAHCGTCGRACSVGQVCSGTPPACTTVCTPPTTMCSGRCVNLQTDLTSCGACGAVCPPRPNATPTCARGTCGFTCNAGFGDCDGNAANGCETSLATSPAHCGACGAACNATNGAATCAAGACGITCNAGFGNCDGNVANGCETNLATSATHCGACRATCSLANATSVCAAGACAVGACNAGFGNCDGVASNGCETNTNTAVAHCGVCRNACNATNGAASCASGACGITCNAGFGNCDGNVANGCETNTSTSSAHCGACGRACAAGFLCSAGTCVRDCAPPLTNCSNVCVNLQGDTFNCGACGRACTFANATPACTTGVCGIASCSPGFGNCDGMLANGCETNTLSTLAHCGMCGNACSFANAAAACLRGGCAMGACNAGFANCDGLTANGCEANTNTSTMHCGGCGMACMAPTNGSVSCVTGTCRQSCNPGYYSISLGSGIICAPITAPRQVAPSSFAWATTPTPTFRWVHQIATTGARLQVCTTRACTTALLDVSAAGTSYTPTAPLPAGRLYWRLYGQMGTNTGLNPSPVWQVFVSPRAAARNASFGVAPDFNGDGFADFAVNDLYATTPTVRVFHGSSAGLPATASASLIGTSGSTFGHAVAPAGDVNGDGYGDLVVGAPSLYVAFVYLGSPTGLGTRITLTGPVRVGFGSSVSWAGDTNDDGYGDVVVGACMNPSPCEGAAYVFHGTSSGIGTTSARRLTVTGVTGFGLYVQGAGELNNDALDDIVVGSPTGAYQFLGTNAAANYTASISGLADLDFAWDVNGDGYSDVVTGIALNTTAVTRAMRVDYGGVNGLGGVAPGGASLAIRTGGPFVAGLGDTNGDGFAEVAWSLINNSVRVHPGSASGVLQSPSVTLTPAAGESDYGWELWHAGDVDGNNRGDLLYELTNTSPCRRVIRYHRATTGVQTAPASTIYLPLTCIF